MPTKSSQLVSILTQDIQSNFQPGDKFYSVREIVTRYKLSLTTVDRALKTLAQEGLIVSSQGKGIFVASGDRGNKKPLRNVCVLAMDYGKNRLPSDHYYGSISLGIQESMMNSDIGLVFVGCVHETLEELATKHQYDGIIFLSLPNYAKDTLRHISINSGMPMVIVGAHWPEIDIPSVDSDMASAGRQAMEYLAEKGHRRIAFVTQKNREKLHDIIRFDVFRSEGKRLGLDIREDWIFEAEFANLPTECSQKIDKAFSSDERPTAVLFNSYYPVSLTILSRFNALGLQIPKDISVMGFDDPQWAATMIPPLTVLRQQLMETGRIAAQKLRMQMDKVEVFSRLDILPTELVERESVADLRAD